MEFCEHEQKIYIFKSLVRRGVDKNNLRKESAPFSIALHDLFWRWHEDI